MSQNNTPTQQPHHQNLVSITYLDPVLKQNVSEIVDPASDRFIELLQAGANDVEIAKPDVTLGERIYALVLKWFKTDNTYGQTEIRYSVRHGQVVFIDFEPFDVRGYHIIKTHRGGHDMVGVELRDRNNPNITKSDRGLPIIGFDNQSDLANMNYVLSTTYKWNADMKQSSEPFVRPDVEQPVENVENTVDNHAQLEPNHQKENINN